MHILEKNISSIIIYKKSINGDGFHRLNTFRNHIMHSHLHRPYDYFFFLVRWGEESPVRWKQQRMNRFRTFKNSFLFHLVLFQRLPYDNRSILQSTSNNHCNKWGAENRNRDAIFGRNRTGWIVHDNYGTLSTWWIESSWIVSTWPFYFHVLPLGVVPLFLFICQKRPPSQVNSELVTIFQDVALNKFPRYSPSDCQIIVVGFVRCPVRTPRQTRTMDIDLQSTDGLFTVHRPNLQKERRVT